MFIYNSSVIILPVINTNILSTSQLETIYVYLHRSKWKFLNYLVPPSQKIQINHILFFQNVHLFLAHILC